MAAALNKLAFKYMDNPKIFLNRIPFYAERVNTKIGIAHRIWGFIDARYGKHAVLPTSRSYSIVGTSEHMGSSSSPSLQLTVFMCRFLVRSMEIGMILICLQRASY